LIYLKTVTSSVAFFFDSLNMEHQDAPETSVHFYQSTWLHIPGDERL